MVKRNKKSQNEYESEDNPIGLTDAFAPIKGPQSVDYDETAGDDPVGLTSAFGAIPEEETNETWNGSDKWKGFDWDGDPVEPISPLDDEDNASDLDEAQEDDASSEAEPSEESDEEKQDDGTSADEKTEKDEGDEADGTKDKADDEPEAETDADTEAEAEAEDKDSALEEEAKEEPVTSQDTTDDTSDEDDDEEEKSVDSQADSSDDESQDKAPAPKKLKGSRGRHAAVKPELSSRMKKSRRIRRILIALLVLLALVVAAVGFFWYYTWTGSHIEAAQQAQEQDVDKDSREILDETPERDSVETASKLADVPTLTSLLGKTQDEALAELGRGAVVTSNNPVNEDGNPIKANLTVALTEEPADSKTGTPTVYLNLDEEGKVHQAGYSASASALGFGALSFSDAVAKEHEIEKTLGRAGVKVEEGAAKLPKNKDEYSTYASDGTTVVRERCSFEGDIDLNGVPCIWSSVLSYDYTTQVTTGNLNDTVRIIYVYISIK